MAPYADSYGIPTYTLLSPLRERPKVRGSLTFTLILTFSPQGRGTYDDSNADLVPAGQSLLQR